MSDFDFSPRLDIAALHGGDVLVTFDSASAEDRKREPRSVRVAEFRQLSIGLSGFDQLAQFDWVRVGERIFAGVVQLKIVRMNSVEDTVALADLEFRVRALQDRRPAQDNNPQFPDVEDLQDAIRTAVADAFGEALARLATVLEGRETASAGGAAAPLSAVEPIANVVPMRASAGAAVRQQERPSARPATDRRERRVLWSIVAGGPLAVILLWGLGKAFSGPAVPSMPPVAQANAYDPAAAEAQIELTKQTLRDMGLDPGDSAADLGCLVQPQ